MNLIYIDDEQPAIDNFRLTTAGFSEIEQLHTFRSGEEALRFVDENVVDVAFLDMEMPGIHGLKLAKRLKASDPNLRIVFVTAYSQYALEAWSVDATGYLLKPYTTHRRTSARSWQSAPIGLCLPIRWRSKPSPTSLSPSTVNLCGSPVPRKRNCWPCW